MVVAALLLNDSAAFHREGAYDTDAQQAIVVKMSVLETLNFL
jgi:hypothetical protein